MEFSGGKNLHTLLLSLCVCVCLCVCEREFDEIRSSEGHNLRKDANLNVSLFYIFFVRVGQFCTESCNNKLLNKLELRKTSRCEVILCL